MVLMNLHQDFKMVKQALFNKHPSLFYQHLFHHLKVLMKVDLSRNVLMFTFLCDNIITFRLLCFSIFSIVLDSFPVFTSIWNHLTVCKQMRDVKFNNKHPSLFYQHLFHHLKVLKKVHSNKNVLTLTFPS